jgi:hypothetical protein
VRGKVAGNEPAEILGAASDDDGLALDAVLGHGLISCRLCELLALSARYAADCFDKAG